MGTHTALSSPGSALSTAHSAPRAAPQSGNRLLASLPADVQQRVQAISTRVALEKAAVLVDAGAAQTHVYFPCSGLLSLQTMTQDGNSVEVVMVSREGVATLPFTADTTAAYATVVTAAGEALRVRADALQTECDRTPTLQRALMRHWNRMMSEIANGSACNRFHTARQRLARWLLTASERIQSSHLELTQEELAQILGLQRTGVTVASVALQDAGAIAARHGRIRILDRSRLQHASCECYGPGA